ncbi:MAG: DUF4202 domain-containing protein [Alphaproteobacteria bacterium]|nr:DUF4202 domain-containing protein [Alphaproteobacteria bacterium]
MSTRLEAVLNRIDDANSADPNVEQDGLQEAPAALLYGQRMSNVLAGFETGAGELLQIAVRGQHIERWKRPRKDYPQGRVGYLEWRRDAARYHAVRVGELMRLEGYSDEECERVGVLIRKKGIKSDAEAQTLEDVACLVFMRWYFSPFASARPADELFRIVEKTARKMSSAGRDAALQLPLPAELVPAITGGE